MDPTLIVTLITTLANTVLVSLGGQGIVSPNLQSLISTLIASASSLFTVFRSGGDSSSVMTSVVANLQNDLAEIEKDTSVDPQVIAQVQEVIKLLQAAIQGYQNAMKTTDPSTLTPLPE